tara:strand:+ start:9045 stop:9761 length:717 start_codon:yes stop_codon:yes gene_type:complete
MITKKDISKGAISNTHISKSAEIDPSKLKGDKVGSILIADRDGKYVPRKIRGDATLLPNGEFKVASTADAGEVTEQEVRNAGGIIGKDITTGSTLVGESDGTPKSVHVGTGSNAIPQRDSSGNLKAETADQATTASNADNATNSTKLNNQEASFYTDVANHTGQAAAYEYEATSLSNVSQSPSTFTHNLGYIPDVIVYQSDGQTPPSFSEIDAEVKSTTTTTDVTVSEGGVSMKVIIK